MRTSLIIILVIHFHGILLHAQTGNLNLTEINRIAERIAQELWGNVIPSNAIPYYSKNNELIGYRFNYSINKPFPVKDELIKSCKEAFESGDHKTQWGIGEFGNIFISARTDLPVINDYAGALSPEYAMGAKLQEIAQKAIGQNVKLEKVYYINFENQWFCYSNGIKEIYICVFPRTQIANKMEFDKIVEPFGFFCSKGDFKQEWDQYLKGTIKPGKAEVWIPNHDGYCMFYDWSYGCTPTAAAMLLSYWDYNSINTADNYSKLIDYHFQRWDGIEGMEWDYQVPNVQKELAIAMDTDTVTGGSTDRNDIAPGYAYVCNNINGYYFNCSFHDHGGDYVWYFNKIQEEVNAGRPIHIGIPDHSECCVAYDAATNLIGVHNTWWSPVQWINRNQLKAVYSIVPANPHGLGINLIQPLGDTNYNQNASGESLFAGDVYEIRWNSDYVTNSYVKLYYSLDGGYNWTQITANTANDGVYDWLLPTGISSGSCRIQSQIYSSGTYSGADGSIGNFVIFTGGNVEVLYPSAVYNTSFSPDYYLFYHPSQTWCAVGVRCVNTGEDWDISLYDDNTFLNNISTSQNGSSDPVDFIVMDGHHTPARDRGIKVSRYSGNGNGQVQYEGGTESINMGNNYYSWSPNGVVEMFDVYLTPGKYKFSLNFTSGISDFDIALYKSNGVPYYANRNAYFSGSFNPGMGVPEEFTCTITSSDHYGLCVWNNENYLADYCIKLEKAGTWTGDADINWHNPANWSGNIVPDATMDVIIPETTNKPWVYAANAECKNLTIYHGTGANFLKVFDEDIHVYGDLTINGQLILDHPAGRLIVDGDVSWESGSTAYFPYYDEFLVYGDWYFNDGANAQINNGTIEFAGTGGSYIYSNDADCYFNSISCNKTGAGMLSFSIASTQNLNIYGDLNIQPNCLVFGSNQLSVVLLGNLYNSGILDCNHGTFVFDGSTQLISEHLSYVTSTSFYNLTVNSSVSTTIANKDLEIKNNLDIESGQFISNSHTISIGGNWYNAVGPSGFDEGTGRVIFNGSFSQACFPNEIFYTLEVNKDPNEFLDVANVECSFYDWTSGGIRAGEFTAWDLLDDGIYGLFWAIGGGTINLYNMDGPVDLNGSLYLGGSVINVYGNSVSNWAYANDAYLYMTTGSTLDFHTQGICIWDSPTYNLTTDLYDGMIKTSGSFWGNSDGFQPEGGIIKFYGTSDATIHTNNGSYLNSVIVDKGSKENKSSTLSLDGNIDIHGWLQINNGTLDANGNDIYLKGYWVNYAGDAGFNESTGTVKFYGESTAIYSNETFNNLIIDMPDPVYNTLVTPDGTFLNINNLYIANGYFGFSNNVNLNITGNITMDNGGIDASLATNTTLTISGNYTDNNAQAGFYPGDETITFNGNGDQYIFAAYGYTLWNNLTINKAGGEFKPNSSIAVFGDLEISNGDWIDNTAGLDHNFFGDFTIGSSGNYYPSGYTIFGGGSDQYYTNNGGLGYFGDVIVDKSDSRANTIINSKNEFQAISFERFGSRNQSLILNSDMVIFNDHTTVIEQGTLNLNGHYYKATGNLEIHDGGNMIVDEGASLSLHSYMFVSGGGTFTTAGVPGNNARVYADGSGDYAIEIELGGTISSTYTTFEDLATTGLWVHDCSFVDPVNSFNNCSFDGYTSPGGSTWLIIDNNQDITIDHISFPNNPGGSLATNIGKNMYHGHITLINASGAFSGPVFEYDPNDMIDWVEPQIECEIRAFLEGPFNGVVMNTNLNDLGYIPLSQPYNTAPWNYPGLESVGSVPNSSVVDWVLIELRNAMDASLAVPSTIISRQAVFMLNDGSLVGLDGVSNPIFCNIPIDHLFLVIQHRNHLGIISANPVTESGGIYTYDFSTLAGQAYGTDSQKNLGGGVYGIYAGDGNADGDINLADKTTWQNQAGKQGYKSGDFNMNGQVSNADKNEMWLPNDGKGTYIPK